MSDKPLFELLNDLPSSSLTTRLLGLLDFAVPGEWENIRTLEDMVKRVTGEEDESLIQSVGERAVMLYNDESLGYRRAVQIYQLVDDTGCKKQPFGEASLAGVYMRQDTQIQRSHRASCSQDGGKLLSR